MGIWEKGFIRMFKQVGAAGILRPDPENPEGFEVLLFERPRYSRQKALLGKPTKIQKFGKMNEAFSAYNVLYTEAKQRVFGSSPLRKPPEKKEGRIIAGPWKKPEAKKPKPRRPR